MKPCFDYAYHYISKFPKTVYELTIQLRKKWYPQEEIDEAITKLSKDKYVDDRQYCELYYSSEVVRKWKPLYGIQYKLKQKWVDKYLVKEVAEEMEEELKEWQKMKLHKEIEHMKQKWIDGVVIIQKLQGRGYHFRLIKEVIHEREEAREVEE